MGAVFKPACQLRSRNSAVVTNKKQNGVYGTFDIDGANTYLGLRWSTIMRNHELLISAENSQIAPIEPILGPRPIAQHSSHQLS